MMKSRKAECYHMHTKGERGMCALAHQRNSALQAVLGLVLGLEGEQSECDKKEGLFL